MPFILDPSVVIKWYVPEVLTPDALRLKERIDQKQEPVAVPDFFFIESANILWKKSFLLKELSRMDAKGIYSRILDASFHRVEDDKLLLKALDLSLDHGMSFYDAMYLAAALRFKAIFVTADLAFTRRLAHSDFRKHVMFLADFA